MSTVASRDLRNHTADVLRRVAGGDVVAVTVRGEVVAEIGPPRELRRRSLSRRELADLIRNHAADAGLRDDLAALDQSTDDLGPVG